MFVTIDLRDNENMTVKSVTFEFQAQETLKELHDKITSVFGIEKDYQQIFNKNDCHIDLSSTSFGNAGIQDNDTIILKHVDLPRWIEYKKCADSVLPQHDDTAAFAKQAVKLHEILTTAGFFELYPQYDNFQREKQPEVASWTEGDVVLIRKATEDYFRNLHDQKRGNEESEFICYFDGLSQDFENRTMRTTAFVRIHDEESVTKYNIKWHYYEGSRAYAMPDVTELYISILLGLIGAGPKSHIIPRTMWFGTKTSTYIAYRMDDFDEFESIEKVIDENSRCRCSIGYAQKAFIHLWSRRTKLRWRGTKNATIFDFAPTDSFSVYDNIKREMNPTCVHNYWTREFSAVRNQHDDNSWLKIAKVYFDKWDISNKIELAREQLDPTKTLLKTMDMDIKHPDWQDSNTKQLDEYINILYKNLENLKTLLNSIV